jgi:hypothetical protein
MNCTEAVSLVPSIGTHVELSADSPAWHAEAFMEGIIMCFRHRPRVRIQALYFNGLKQFDYRQKRKTKIKWPTKQAHENCVNQYK